MESGTVGRINVRDVWIAFLIQDDKTGATFEVPVLIPGTMQVLVAPRVASETIYGDGNARYTVIKVGGYDVTLDHNMIPPKILSRMRGQAYVTGKKIRRSNVSDVQENFAMGWTVDLTGKFVEVTWLPKCTATPPSRNAQQTTGSSINHSPDSMTITALPLEYNGDYEYIADTSDKESGFTPADAASFFNEVPVVPPITPAGVQGLATATASEK